jgi:hypothetical protein
MTNEIGLELQQPEIENIISRDELSNAYEILLLSANQRLISYTLQSEQQAHKQKFNRWPLESLLQFCANHLNAVKPHD